MFGWDIGSFEVVGTRASIAALKAHGGVALGGRADLDLIRRSPAAAGRGDLRPQAAVRREHAVIPNAVNPLEAIESVSRRSEFKHHEIAAGIERHGRIPQARLIRRYRQAAVEPERRGQDLA